MGSSPLARGLRLLRIGDEEDDRIIPARAGFTLGGRAVSRSRGDHPRSRGVYSLGACRMILSRGSSPLARGLQSSKRILRHILRIIPARAGFTRSLSTPPCLDRDHPRSRGVYIRPAYGAQDSAGSSPLARGLRLEPLVTEHEFGIIPARAGFTLPGLCPSYLLWDHPRSRGVYLKEPAQVGETVGSSPLARGLPSKYANAALVLGIIPARAGFTRRPARRGRYPRDHPRSRGVYRRRIRGWCDWGGSSPLARGLPGPQFATFDAIRIIPARAGFTMRNLPFRKRHGGSSPLARGLRGRQRGRRHRLRIIPARAGFTDPMGMGSIVVPDHPRSRGVYVHGRQDHGLGQGSSPLARGLRRRLHHRHAPRWIIPARAGFTNGPGYEPGPSRDHPRSRGVYAAVVCVLIIIAGSSPLARGLPFQLFWDDFSLRIIPARAGFTLRRFDDGEIRWGSSPLARGLPCNRK